MLFTKDDYKLVFEGYIIKDCVIRSEDKQIYLLVEDNDEKVRDGYDPQYRFVFTFNEREDPDQRLYCVGREDLSFPIIAYNKNGNETLGLDIMAKIYSHSAGEREESDLPVSLLDQGSNKGVIYQNLKRVGESLYAVGYPHRLLKRIAFNEWEDLSDTSIPLPPHYFEGYRLPAGGRYEEPGWSDIAGFSEQDIYLAGGKGSIWQYDGNKFKQCYFPSNEIIRNVCCAEDGYVYIGGRLGRLWKGKEDKWELISSREFSVFWNDIVSFDNRLFLSSDYGLWEFKDNKIITAEVPSEVILNSGTLSICPENKYLLTAGNHGVSMYDGKEWEILFSASEYWG